MTHFRGAISGTHPLGEELIQAILDFKYGRAGKERVKKLFQEELTSLIQLQEDLGFPIISSGSFGIEDLIRPFTRSLTSLKSYQELGDLPINRYHYTNTFYRQPTLIEELPQTGTVLLDDKHSLSENDVYSHKFLEGKKGKLILPGPVSFASLIKRDTNGPYNSYNDFIIASGEYLAAEISNLPAQYVEIQFDEPILVWNRLPRTLRPAIIAAYDELAKVTKGKTTIVSTYFETCENILSFLLELPISGVGIDFLKTNLLSLSEMSFSDKIIQAGILDSQNFVPTNTGELDTTRNNLYSNFITGLLELDPKEVIISSTTGLEYLPREIADQRLKQVADIVQKIKEN